MAKYTGDNLPRAVKEIEYYGLTVPGCTVISIEKTSIGDQNKMYAWCRDDDCLGYFGYELDDSINGTYTARFYFTHTPSAVAFKMRWA